MSADTSATTADKVILPVRRRGSCRSKHRRQAPVVINNEDRRRYIAALFPTEGEEPVIIELASPAVDVSVFKGLAYIMTQDSVMAYDFDGSLRSTAAVTDSYTGFVRSDDHIFLKGYNRIDRIDYDAGD